jgi:two-component system chemotaxis response regulator CheY
MAPEQTLGLPTVDRRADVYSLGCTLFYLLVGRPPYQGQTLMATLLEHREGPIPSLAAERTDVPPALDQVFQRMVAKKPEDRFDSMDEVVRALEAVAQGPAPAVPVASEGNAADTRGMTALLVEPSRSQAVIIRGYLQKLGFRDCPTAPSGAKALEFARNTPPDVVISAMHLPDMTGVQLAQSMRTQPRSSSAGFILITSEMTEEEAAQVLGEGGNTIRLPKPFDLDRLAEAIAATSGRPQPPTSSSSRSGVDRLRALVVDDSAAARAHVRAVLAALGLRHVVEAADGVEAIALLGKESYDLVVTDYMMPRLGGRELIAFIRQRSSTPTVPVILVTTETDQSRLDAIRQLGVSAICDKRFEREVVRGVLETLG